MKGEPADVREVATWLESTRADAMLRGHQEVSMAWASSGAAAGAIVADDAKDPATYGMAPDPHPPYEDPPFLSRDATEDTRPRGVRTR